MTDKPVKTYIVSVFEKPRWRTLMSLEFACSRGCVEMLMERR
jgi:hypothetical protein